MESKKHTYQILLFKNCLKSVIVLFFVSLKENRSNRSPRPTFQKLKLWCSRIMIKYHSTFYKLIYVRTNLLPKIRTQLNVKTQYMKTPSLYIYLLNTEKNTWNNSTRFIEYTYSGWNPHWLYSYKLFFNIQVENACFKNEDLQASSNGWCGFPYSRY